MAKYGGLTRLFWLPSCDGRAIHRYLPGRFQSSAIVSFGLPLGGVWVWSLLFAWLCIDWINNLEMWKMSKLVTATITTGLNALGALRGQDGKRAAMPQAQ